MADNIIKITEEGYKKLQEELDYLRTVKRNEVRESVKVARSFGDLSENAEYDAARNEQAQVEAQIAELEEKISRMQVVSDDEVTTDKVNVGSIVKIHNVTYDEYVEYYLVGSTEADPFANKISDTSPVGKAIIGAKVGDTVTVRLPRGDVKIIILEISK